MSGNLPNLAIREEFEPKSSILLTQDAELAVAEVDRGAVAIYVSNYRDQMKPDYLVFRDLDSLRGFEVLVAEVRESRGKPAPYDVLKEIEDLVGTRIETTHLTRMYHDGQWAYPREEFLRDAAGLREQEEDDDWFEAQGEHFSPEAIEKRRLEAEERRARKQQIWIEQGGDDEDV